MRNRPIRRILELSGFQTRVGIPRAGDTVAVWGDKGRTTRRGRAMAQRFNASCLYLEDAFLRSVTPTSKVIHGLVLDGQRPYYDGSGPSDLEDLLATHPLDNEARGQRLIDRLRTAGLSKYNAHDPALSPSAKGYVLVVDQLRGDASIEGAGADAARFDEMLATARREHPGRDILIKAHPAATTERPGHFQDGLRAPVCSWALLAEAHAVYTVSSQMGFEAILEGHRPVVFGNAFYAGWGLSDDRSPSPARRQRQLTPAQMALGALALYPVWYDPCRDQLCDIETVVPLLEAQIRAWREDHKGSIAHQMRLWKRDPLRRFFADGPVRFTSSSDAATAQAARHGATVLLWGQQGQDLENKAHAQGIATARLEDGFIRSKGLGAELTPPLSLVRDKTGIYYDPDRPSDLEIAIARRATIGPSPRGRSLLARLRDGRISKYNLDRKAEVQTTASAVLVVGQVADDASVWHAAEWPLARTDALLKKALELHPSAAILFKPHPDVEQGLRDGDLDSRLADSILRDTDPISALEAVDEVWTISSLLGFEALIRGKRVVCAGVPFYAGWGLTEDLAPRDHPAFARRKAKPELAALVEAAVIDYPRYWDPVSRLACPVEVLLDRIENDTLPSTRPSLHILSKLQGLLASQAWLWR